MGKKKFINKKNSATFQLLARDSSDPVYHDDSPGSDRIFIRVDNNPYSVSTFFPEEEEEEESNSIFADAPDDEDDDVEDGYGITKPKQSAGTLPDDVRREILELGFPDDGYNYLTHLREIKNTGGRSAFYANTKAKLDQVPLDVKAYDASRVQVPKALDEVANEDAIYEVAAKSVGVRIQKAVDPEVEALLQDDNLSRFGSDDEDLEEDFVVKANLFEDAEDDVVEQEFNVVKRPEVAEEKIIQFGNRGTEENHGDNFGDCEDANGLEQGGVDFVDEKLRARRPLDEQFDLLELQEYGSDIDDDYDGFIGEEDEMLADKLNHVLKDHPVDDLESGDKYIAPADILHDLEKPKSAEALESATEVIRRCVEYAEKYENEDGVETEVVFEESSDESGAWDCETIVSTYSTLDNHPGKIQAPETSRKKKLSKTVSEALSNPNPIISLRGKQKLPVDFLPNNSKATAETVKGVDDLKTEQHKRKQQGQESKEEKKERKAAVKEERREARRVKKEIKVLYRCETERAQRVAAISGPSSIHLM